MSEKIPLGYQQWGGGGGGNDFEILQGILFLTWPAFRGSYLKNLKGQNLRDLGKGNTKLLQTLAFHVREGKYLTLATLGGKKGRKGRREGGNTYEVLIPEA